MPDLFGGRRPAGFMPPPGLVPRINRRSRLAVGLVGLWFPAGGSLILDLTGNMAPLTASRTANGVGPYGYQARDTSSGPSFWTSATVPAVQKPQQFSLLYVGQYLGSASSPSQQPDLIGCSWTSNTSPYDSWGVYWAGGSSPAVPRLMWNNGTFQNIGFSGVQATGTTYSMVGTVLPGGTAMLWNAGRLVTTGAAPSGAIGYSSSAFYIGGGGAGASSNVGFGFSLAALWSRVLTAGEAQSLSADPWQILEWPFDRIPRSFTRVNLTLLFDRLVPTEFKTGVLEPGSLDTSPYLDTGDGSWLDTGDGSYLDAGIYAPAPWAPLEIVGNVEMGPRDIVLPLEGGLAARRDAETPIEDLGCVALTDDSRTPIELQASTATDRSASAESGALNRLDSGPPSESTALSRLDAPTPAASGESVALHRPVPVEASGTGGADAALAAEWLGQPPIVVFTVDWLELLASTRVDPPTAATWAATLAAGTLPPIEALGRAPLIVLTVEWLEWLASQRADAMPAEWEAKFRADAAASGENAARQWADAPSPIEAQGTATREELPVEWLAIAPRGAAAAAEWTAKFAADGRQVVEWAALSASDRAAIAEWLHSYVVDPNSLSPIEFGQTNPPSLFLVERGRLRVVPADGRMRGEPAPAASAAVLPPSGAAAALAAGGTISFAASMSVPAVQTGWSFDNAGATAPVVFSLPPWAPNLAYTVLVVAPQLVTIVAYGNDTIALGGNLAGLISSQQPYSAVTLRTGNAAGVWIAVSFTGDWDA